MSANLDIPCCVYARQGCCDEMYAVEVAYGLTAVY